MPMQAWTLAELSTPDPPTPHHHPHPHPPVSNTKVAHNPCSSFIIEMWMRKVRGWLSSIGQHRNIWLSPGRLCQDTPLHGNKGGHFECTKRLSMYCNLGVFKWLFKNLQGHAQSLSFCSFTWRIMKQQVYREIYLLLKLVACIDRVVCSWRHLFVSLSYEVISS